MAERSWRTWLAGHRRTRLVLGKGTGIGRLWTSWKSRRLRNSWAGLGVDRSRRTRLPVKGRHDGYWEQVPRKGWRKRHGGHGLPVIGRHGWYWFVRYCGVPNTYVVFARLATSLWFLSMYLCCLTREGRQALIVSRRPYKCPNVPNA